jgi:hypothetical protein
MGSLSSFDFLVTNKRSFCPIFFATIKAAFCIFIFSYEIFHCKNCLKCIHLENHVWFINIILHDSCIRDMNFI